MSQEKLESIFANGDAKACVKHFAKLSEDERQAMAKAVQALAQPILDDPFISRPATDLPLAGLGAMTSEKNPRLPTAQVAALAACSFAQIKKLWRQRWSSLPDDDLLFAIFSARKPDWLDDWAAWASERSIGHWSILRRLVRAGLCRKPDNDNYTLGMITNVCPYHDSKGTIHDALVNDPDLLREDVWRLFEVEGDTNASLSARDKYVSRQENTWSYAFYAFVRLAKEEKLPRKRLLNASLDALTREFGTFQAGWFSRFHEALEPTLKERAERVKAYISLLASRVAPTVSFALKALLLLTKNHLIEPKPLLASISPALANRHKGTVQSALQLLDQVSKQNSALQSQVGIALAEALLHTSPDVHKQAIDLLTRRKGSIGAELADLLRERLDHVAASQRQRLLALIASESPMDPATDDGRQPDIEEKELRKRAAALDSKWRNLAGVDRVLACLDSGQVDLPGLDFDPMKVPRLDSSQRLTSIDSVYVLTDVCAHVLENPDNTAGLERVFDGISRLCAERPSDFEARTGPLRKRALDRMAQLYAAPFVGNGPLIDLCGLVSAWLGGDLLMAKKSGVHEYDKNVDLFHFENAKRRITLHVSRYPTVAKFQSQRVLEIAQRCIAGYAAPLLAAPTHQGGWIEPIALVERAIARQDVAADADRCDQIQALLRLAPDGRAVARKAAGKVRGEFGEALRYSLGCDEAVGSDAPMWIAAARARNPFGNDDQLRHAHPGLGPNASDAVTYQPRVQPIPNDSYHRKQLRMDVKPAWPKSVGIDAITVLLTPRKRAEGSWHREFTASAEELHWMLLIWPIQREAWFGAWVQSYADNLDWWEVAWGDRVFLEPLLDPDVPLGPMARLMLALGLAAKEPGQSSLATDALIATIEDARFDSRRFGETLAFLLPMLKTARLARTLAQAARISPLHRHLLGRTVQASLRGSPETAPRDLSALLEFLNESLIEGDEGITDSDARAYLEKLKVSGKSAQLVRDLLLLESNPQPRQNKHILLHSLKTRIQRAESFNTKRS